MALRFRRPLAAFVALACFVVGAGAGCNDDSGDDADGGPTQPSGDTVDANAVEGGTLRIAIPKPATIDPAVLSPGSHNDLLLADLLYDGLTARSNDGQIVPSIASSWKGSKNQRTWRFAVAAGRTFGDGEPIDGVAVKRAFEHVAAKGDSSFTAARLDVIEGYDKLAAKKSKNLSGITVKGNTVFFELTRAMSTFPELLSSPLYGITQQGAFGDGVPRPSSPFLVAKNDASGFTLARQEGSPGFVDGVEVRYYDDPDAAYDAFDNGDADWAPVPTELVGQARDDHSDDNFVPFHAELFLGMNVRLPEFQRREFRQAIYAAIDREAIVNTVYAASAEQLGVLVPRGVPGYKEDRCGALCGPDVEKAKKLLKEAYPKSKPPTVMVDVDASESQKRMAAIVVDNLKQAGITAKVRPHKFEDYKKFAVSGKQQLFSFGWIGLYDSPDAYLTALFTSGGPDNVTGTTNDDITALLTGARKTASASRRAELWARAEKAILESAVLVPVAQFRTQVVVSDRVQGMAIRTDGTFDITKIWLDD